MSEYRKSDRVRVNCPVEVKENGVEGAIRCSMADVSPGGCYIETVLPFPIATELQLSFSPQGFPVHAKGLVQYVHPAMGMGIKFTWKDEEPFNRLMNILQNQQASAASFS